MKQIKTAEKLLEPYMLKSAGKVNIKDAIDVINEARLELLDYISDNIDADYDIVGKLSCEDQVEVYVPKGQFNEFKKMIK